MFSTKSVSGSLLCTRLPLITTRLFTSLAAFMCANIVVASLVATSAMAAPELSYKILAERTHKPILFTQGLLVDGGYFYETSGLYNRSMLVSYPIKETGSTWAKISAPFTKKQTLANHYFAEGLALLDDKLYLLTWMEKTLLVYDKATFSLQKTMSYSGEGWGLTTDGKFLIRSDGSAMIYFHQPDNFEISHAITVKDGEAEVSQLNELEYAEGFLWANIWHDDRILKIDPKTGKVLAQLDLSALKQKVKLDNSEQVLNGIAWDQNQNAFWITGKQWPKMFLISIKKKVE